MNFWQAFWSNYGPEHAVTEEDLFKQVAQTRNKRPISKELFKRTLDHIVDRLKLSSSEHLVDLCCGNGLVSYELASHVAYVTGIDFVPRNINTATQLKSKKNVCYVLGDVTAPLAGLIGVNTFPDKFLMNGSLAYFEPTEFGNILKNIVTHMAGRPFLFLLTSIPCSDLKWNFYDTPERVARHLINEKHPGNTNDGVGRWWKHSEIQDICFRHGLHVEVTNQPADLSNFRMDALIASLRKLHI